MRVFGDLVADMRDSMPNVANGTSSPMDDMFAGSASPVGHMLSGTARAERQSAGNRSQQRKSMN